MRKPLCFLALVLLGLAVSTAAPAHTLLKQNSECWICGTEFVAVFAGSGNPHGYRLDTKYTGAIYQPWPIAQCPNCRNPMVDKTRFSQNKMEKIKAYVLSESFKAIPADAPSHFCLAKVMEHIGTPWDRVGLLYLQASWQAEGTEELDSGSTILGWKKNPQMQELALRESLRCFNEFSPTDKTDPQYAFTTLFLRAELNRRLGDFTTAAACLETAREFFEAKSELIGFVDKQNLEFDMALIEQQKKWIELNDPQPKEIDTSGLSIGRKP